MNPEKACTPVAVVKVCWFKKNDTGKKLKASGDSTGVFLRNRFMRKTIGKPMPDMQGVR